MIKKLVYLIGVKYRNNLIWDRYNFLCESQHWNIDNLEAYQFQKCKDLLEWAYHNTRFYKEKYDKIGVSPCDFERLDDLKRFPLVTKEDLLERNKDIQLREGFQKLFVAETSGSTGKPLIFYINREWDASHRAAILR
jgi:phenylacetate-CoA ligase